MKFQTISKVGITAAVLLFVVGMARPETAQATNTSSTAPKPPTSETVSLSSGAQDILKLARAKVDDDVTLAFIRHSDRRYDLTAAEIIHLREAGVTDRVLAAMITHQPETSVATQPAPASGATTPALVASAPQYANPPELNAALDTTQPSTVYVTSGAPAYYSFYDPWPYYWYDPWPHYWYSYPYLAFGWYWGWGGCYYGYHGDCWDDHHHCGNWGHSSSHNGNASTDSNQSPTRTPPTRGAGSADSSSRSVASAGRPSPGMTAAASSSTARADGARPTRTAPGRATSYWSNNDNPSAAGNQRDTAATSPNQSTRPGTVAGNGATGRTVSQRGDQFVPGRQPAALRADGSQPNAAAAGRPPAARPTSTWTSGSSPATARPVAPSGRTAAAPTAFWNQSAAASANRYSGRPAMSYSSGSRGPAYSARSPGYSASYSRPSMSAPARSMGSSSAVRSGGSYGGGGRPSMSSGGGYRGGGGGGRSR